MKNKLYLIIYMTKIIDFLNQKIVNFKKFIEEQIEKIKVGGVELEERKIINIRNDLNEFENNVNNFVICVSNLQNCKIDDCVKLFLLRYDIDINIIKNLIDYEKLSKYIEMFIDIIKNNVN